MNFPISSDLEEDDVEGDEEGKKKGQMKGNKKGGKRPRESAETPPPPPSPPPTPTPTPSFGETETALKLIEDPYSGCPPELNMRFEITRDGLVTRGIIPNANNRLKTDESFKKSWDMGPTRPISHEKLIAIAIASDPSKKEEVERYLNSAAKNKYFDVPDSKERPDKLLSRGFFVIYPEGQDQKDPIFRIKPNFTKFVPLISKLAIGAVECHKFMTGSDLKFSKVKKANLFCHPVFQVYFITLEATDKLSGKEVTCQSSVVCIFAYHEMWLPELKEDLLPIKGTFVESFHRVED